MLRLDELETISRLAAGELSAGKAEQVKNELQRRPELAVALEASLDGSRRHLVISGLIRRALRYGCFCRAA